MVNNNNVRGEMARFGLKIDDMSKMLDVSYPTFANKLNGHRDWKLTEAKVLVDIFNEQGADYTIDTLFF